MQTFEFQEQKDKREQELQRARQEERDLKVIGECEHCGTQKILDGFLTVPFTYCPSEQCPTRKGSTDNGLS